MTLLSFIDRLLPRDGKLRGLVLLIIGGVFGLIGPWCANGILASFAERASFPMTLQRIQFLRETAATIPCDERVLAFAPIVAQVTDMDLRITHEHETQRHLYSRFFSPRAWLQVEPIPVPCGIQETRR